MNRCVNCGRNIKNAETSYGLEFCKYCEKYEQQLEEKDKEIENLKSQLKGACEKYHIKCAYLHQQDREHRIECLIKLKEKMKLHCEYCNSQMLGWVLPESKIDLFINEKIAEIEGEKVNGEN